ncbi:MAG: Glu/Leu/Phe/Val dehydrogenase [Thermoanaerobacterales bacterium]|nr:Glu/Leu/Phe/Val dehydrogenase [Thermoanaerobacterales bacterium]
MKVMQQICQMGHEQVVFCNDPKAGLKAIIAIHSTKLGPALGGLRMWNYKCEEDALIDVLRLSRGMTYKNAAMELGLGGGKAVILGDPKRDKTPELFKSFGRFVESLGGRYVTAEDVGTSEEDMSYIAQECSHVVGLSNKSGNPSPITAYGVFLGIKASVEWLFGSDDLSGIKVAQQGLGQVGLEITRLLTEHGASVVVADIDPEKVRQAQDLYGVAAVESEKIYEVQSDIFCPCALGAVINEDTVYRLDCKIIAGSANNQLKNNSFAKILEDRGILYAPDYIVNGGGVINVSQELAGGLYRTDKTYEKLNIIPVRLKQIFELAKSKKITTAEAADEVTEEILKRK